MFTQLYMMQNDVHAPGTTVYEALEFSAQMRVLDVDRQKLKDFVDQVSSQAKQLTISEACRHRPQSMHDLA